MSASKRPSSIHPVVGPPIPHRRGLSDSWKSITSRDGAWGVTWAQWLEERPRTCQLWHHGEPVYTFDCDSRFESDFAVSNCGHVGFKLTAKFDSENLFHETRFAILGPTGETVYNKKIHALIEHFGVTHDERVLWCTTGYSKKMQTHHNASFCVDLESGKLAHNGFAFAGPVTNSGYDDADGEWGRTLWFEGTWKSGVRITS